MAILSNMFPPVFCGEHFDHWSLKMKTIFMSEDLWEYVEEGYKEPAPTMLLTAEQKEQLKKNRSNDAKALSLIQRGLSSCVFSRILNAKTAKEAWDILHKEFQMDASASALEMVECAMSVKPMLSSARTHLNEHGITALLGEPFYDLVLSKSHFKTTCHMTFPPRLDPVLPSATVPAIIRCFGKTWEIKFCGARRPKGFDSSWEKFVNDNNLEVGDALLFEHLESSPVNITFKVQILRGTIPPELQKLINKRRAEFVLVNTDDKVG